MDQLGKVMKVALALALGALAFFGGSRVALAGTPDKKPAAAQKPAQDTAKQAAPAPRVIPMSVTERGFEPNPINVKKGEPLKLVITRKTDETCATSINFDDPKIHQDLPLNQPVEVTFTPQKSGELKYGCAMGKMVGGVILVE